MRLACLLSIGGWLALSPAISLAQTTSTVLGTVKDASGALVPEASVTAVNKQTGYSRTAPSDSTGAYSIPLLPPGTYTVRAERPGFKKTEQQGVPLTVGQNVRVDLVLALGEVSETVTVAGEATQVDTSQATISHLMDQTRMTELPLNGRSPASLAALLPGVGTLSVPTRPSIGGISVSMNGTRTNAQQFLLDGAPFNAVQRSDGNPLPPPDVVQEFRVLANPYSADFGRNAGGLFSTVTKSGTNELHGGAWEFLRNDKLNARNFFSPTVPILRQNQFGASAGGPVLLPYYQGRNRTFFFGAYQGTRIRETTLVNSAFPATAVEQQGDFSQASRKPNDPLTGRPFPGDLIPASRVDPAATRVLQRLPGANTADGRYVSLASAPTDQNQFMVKIDHQVHRSNNLSVKYWYDDASILNPWPSGNMPWSPGLFAVRIQTASLSDTHIFSPTLLNQLYFSFTRRNEDRYNSVRESAPDLGIRIARPSVPFLPNITVTGRFTLGTQINGVPTKRDNTFSLLDTLGWTRGKHGFKAGITWEAPSFHGRPKFDNGAFTFSGQITGVALADFLLGRPVTFTQDTGREDNHTAQYWGLFFQDDYRVSPRITLNLGLRYQYDVPTVHRRDRQATLAPGKQSQKYPEAPLGLLYPGDYGLPRSLYYADKNNLAPRIGIAWDVMGNGRTSVRTGYGVFYQIPPVGHSNLLDTNQPFVMSASLTDPYSLSDPWRGKYNGGVDDPVTTFDPSPGKGVFKIPATGGYSIDPNLRSGYIQQYSFSLQRQLPWQTVVDIGYVGNNARKLVMSIQLNPAIPGPGATLANIEQRRRYSPGILGSFRHFQGTNNSNYNSLQASVNKRFSRGVLFSLAYTYSKALDFYSDTSEGNVIQNSDDVRSERGPAAFDRTQILAGSFVWEMPFFTKAGNALLRHVAGGWQAGAMWRLTSGAPFTVVSGRDNSLTGIGFDRPDVLRDPELSTDRPRSDLIARYFDTTAFVANASGRFGNAGRGILRGPGSANVDFDLMKNFRLREGLRLQFRSEFFNLFNRVNLGTPGASLAAPANLGRILSAGDPRLVQFALKLMF